MAGRIPSGTGMGPCPGTIRGEPRDTAMSNPVPDDDIPPDAPAMGRAVAGGSALLVSVFWAAPLLGLPVALAALLANAFAAGALSGPHDRYQARIAWLVLLPLLFHAVRTYAARLETSAGLMRTRAS